MLVSFVMLVVSKVSFANNVNSNITVTKIMKKGDKELDLLSQWITAQQELIMGAQQVALVLAGSLLMYLLQNN